MGGIDEAALDRLSLVTQMTKHIRVRASGGRTTSSELGQFSPIFVWLLRVIILFIMQVLSVLLIQKTVTVWLYLNVLQFFMFAKSVSPHMCVSPSSFYLETHGFELMPFHNFKLHSSTMLASTSACLGLKVLHATECSYPKQ